MRDNKKLKEYFFVTALFCFGLCYYCFHILGFDLSGTPGDYGDSRFINYILEHGFKWLKGQDPDFWRANFMYPLKDNVAISDSMAGALPLYALFRFTGIDVETSYQLWWLSTCILNFWCCFFAFKKIGFNVFLCAIGAYVFAFGINTFNQFQHLQFNFKFFIPVAIAALYLFLNRPYTRYFIVFVLSSVLQFYASAYLGIILIYFSLAFAGVYLLNRDHRKLFFGGFKPKQILNCLLTVVAGGLLLLIIAVPYHSMAETVGYRNYEVETLPYLPSIYSYFFVGGSSLTWDILKNSPLKQLDSAWYLQELFPGAFCYLGLVVMIVYCIRQLIKKQPVHWLPVTLFIVILFFILVSSKSMSGFSLFSYFRNLPGLMSMRILHRFMIINVFLLIWLSLYFVDKLPAKGLALYSLLALLVINDNLFSSDHTLLSISPKKIREDRVTRMCERIQQSNTEHKKIIVCINVTGEPEAFMQNDVMLACQKLNLYTLNGYSSTCIGELCGAYSDPAHVKLSRWLQQYSINEKDVLFITNAQ